MVEKIEGLVLDIVRHNDSNNVVTLYTRGRGRVAFLVPVGKSKAGRMRNSSIRLLAWVEAEVNFKPGKELHFLRCVSVSRVWRSLYFNPLKTSLVFFLAEFLNRLLRQSPPDADLWDYIRDSIRTLDGLDERLIANFHIAFLLGLLARAGVLPSPQNYEQGMVFDMQQGVYGYPELILQGRGQVLLTEEESAFIPRLLRMNYRNMNRFRFTRDERNRLLQRLLQYFSLHLPYGDKLKSLDVLRELLS